MHRGIFAALLATLTAGCAEQQPTAPTWMDRLEARCADENPIDAAERDACVNTHIGNQRRAAQAEREQARELRLARRDDRAGPITHAQRSATVSAAFQGLGQGMQAFGRQLAAPAVHCTSIGMGYMVSTTCR